MFKRRIYFLFILFVIGMSSRESLAQETGALEKRLVAEGFVNIADADSTIGVQLMYA